LIANWRQGTEIVRTRSRERLCKKGKGQWGNEEKREEKKKEHERPKQSHKKLQKVTEKRTQSREILCIKEGKDQWENEEKREEKEKNTNDLNKITKKYKTDRKTLRSSFL